MMSYTDQEKELLARMKAGELDGYAGSWDAGKSYCRRVIEGGIPRVYKDGPGDSFFNGKENEPVPGVRHLLQEWKTDDEKLTFLQKYGWLMEDPEVRDYSALFKPNR